MPLNSSATVTTNANALGSVLALAASGSICASHVPRSLSRAQIGGHHDGTRSIHYYITRVSKDISSYFDTDFWNNLVLQVSEEEPAVRHAVLALSALYEAGETSQLLQYPSSNDRYNYLMRFAIYEYTKAVSTLFVRMNTNGPLLEVIMMSCLVFTWIEFLRNNVDDALRHLRSGLRILCQQQQAGSRKVVEQVAHILGRVLIQATLHGSSTVEFDYYATIRYNPGGGTLYFTSLKEARCDIDGKINGALRFLGRIKNVGYAEIRHGHSTFPELQSLNCVHRAHNHDLEQWQRAFESLRDRLDIDALTADALQAIHQLELCYLLISNTFDTLFATTPMVFDKYNDAYARMLYLSRRILQNQILRKSNSLFTLPFDNSVQGALFYIVLRCRHLPIRREAVQLLQLCPDNEGIWQRACLVAFCNWKIGVEEKGRPEGALETDPLPESARVYAEKAREVVRDGQTLVGICYKRGASHGTSDVRSDEDEEEVTNLSMRLAGLLRTWGTWSLYSTAEPNDATIAH
ncbi:Transcriptional regulatory protein moc3-like protein 4 [Paraphaeosphaeria sporulosa]